MPDPEFCKRLILNYPLDPTYLSLREAIVVLYSYRVQPEFCYSFVVLDVHVLGFFTVSRIEKDTVRPHS